MLDLQSWFAHVIVNGESHVLQGPASLQVNHGTSEGKILSVILYVAAQMHSCRQWLCTCSIMERGWLILATNKMAPNEESLLFSGVCMCK